MTSRTGDQGNRNKLWPSTLRRARMLRRNLNRATAATSIALVSLAPLEAAAVSCPGGGAQLDVCVENPTNAPVTLQVAGSAIGSTITCTGPQPPIQPQYSMNVTIGAGMEQCFQPSHGLWSGVWKHWISASTSGQLQY
jgi:hypothetical protein